VDHRKASSIQQFNKRNFLFERRSLYESGFGVACFQVSERIEREPPMGVKERKEREKLQRANDILEASRHMFESNGFLNTTLQDVAKEAEISVGLIYRYFQSKEDIFASLALKGAEQFDREIETILKRATGARKKPPAAQVLAHVAKAFFDFYGPYGEYFDMLIYSYKGLKEVQIHGNTLTRLMSVTLSSLDRIKLYILDSSQFRAKDEDEALRVVFLLWGILLGCHKLFDSSGRGHLFAFRQEDFVKQMIDQILLGISNALPEGAENTKRNSGPSLPV
jgi:AcrR family transcriptional regulator